VLSPPRRNSSSSHPRVFLLGALGLQGSRQATLIRSPALGGLHSILTTHYDGDTELASSVVLVSTIFSLFTISFLIAYVTGGAL
jgi:predicted permease